MQRLTIYDATLREGAQEAQAAFTVEDKLRIYALLDELGVDYVEGGNPGGNPKDAAFFQRAQAYRAKHTKLVAFGATMHANATPETDENLKALLDANTDVVAIFGKSWVYHLEQVLHISREHNLRLIEQSIRYLKVHGKEVVYDAEHFFDGYKADSEYALKTLMSAQQAGADWICLCDTNGGCFPFEVEAITAAAKAVLSIPLGFHGHNDTGMADANSLVSVRAGATMVQLTLCGVGERCGNASLATFIANAQVKLGMACLPQDKLPLLYGAVQRFEGIANLQRNERAPYVGVNAFTHKAGMHIDAITKAPASFEHIDPAAIGAHRRIVLSDQAGRAALLQKAQLVEPSLKKEDPLTAEILKAVKQLEHEGVQFEQADASFALLVKRMAHAYEPFFELIEYQVLSKNDHTGQPAAQATVTIRVGEQTLTQTASGNGPVNALDSATRLALQRFYPSLGEMVLADFKVRVLDGEQNTASVVRVLIESRDGDDRWTTVGVSGDILQACWRALVDSFDYKLLKHKNMANA